MAEQRQPSPATLALGQLRLLVHRLADEVATFRRRALQAEARVNELEDERRASAEAAGALAPGAATAPVDPAMAARIAELERENAELRDRLAQAAERTRQLLERTRFLRQQQRAEREGDG